MSFDGVSALATSLPTVDVALYDIQARNGIGPALSKVDHLLATTSQAEKDIKTAKDLRKRTVRYLDIPGIQQLENVLKGTEDAVQAALKALAQSAVIDKTFDHDSSRSPNLVTDSVGDPDSINRALGRLCIESKRLHSQIIKLKSVRIQRRVDIEREEMKDEDSRDHCQPSLPSYLQATHEGSRERRRWSLRLQSSSRKRNGPSGNLNASPTRRRTESGGGVENFSDVVSASVVDFVDYVKCNEEMVAPLAIDLDDMALGLSRLSEPVSSPQRPNISDEVTELPCSGHYIQPRLAQSRHAVPTITITDDIAGTDNCTSASPRTPMESPQPLSCPPYNKQGGNEDRPPPYTLLETHDVHTKLSSDPALRPRPSLAQTNYHICTTPLVQSFGANSLSLSQNSIPANSQGPDASSVTNLYNNAAVAARVDSERLRSRCEQLNVSIRGGSTRERSRACRWRKNNDRLERIDEEVDAFVAGRVVISSSDVYSLDSVSPALFSEFQANTARTKPT